MSKRYSRQLRWFWAFMLPAMLIYTIFWVVPILFNFLVSFTNWKGIDLSQMNFIGLRNYMNIFKDDIFFVALSHNFIIMFFNVALLPAAAFIVALLIEKFVKTKGFFRTTLFIPSFLPMLLIAILFRWVYSIDGGMVNSLLEVVGLGALQTDFLGNSNTALYSVIFIGLWKSMPFHMLIILSGLQSVPDELEEVAVIDGAGFWKRVWHVIIPILQPILVVVFGLVIIDGFRIFELIFVTTNGGPGYYSTEVMTTYIYRSAFSDFRLGYSTALSMLNIIIVLIISMIYFRYSMKSNQE